MTTRQVTIAVIVAIIVIYLAWAWSTPAVPDPSGGITDICGANPC